ncbi:MAG TPA: dephospho-CoA kinase [Syntrophomonadaceae bacterium]|nr:dephospho-CoA kinase [Syntrophomonadaceae bacterium]
MKILGLTGGIASGKSTVSQVFKELGAYIIDADKVAHEIVEPGNPAWRDVIRHFGDEIINPDSTINREKLGDMVFGNEELLDALNKITHPRVMERFKDELQCIRTNNPDAIVIMEVPLLYETHLERLCDLVIVVWLDRETQIKRLMLRDKISEEAAIKRIDSQMDLDEKAKLADYVIDNRKTIEETIKIATKYYNEINHNTVI